MSDFHERLAHLADIISTLPGGEESARILMRLASDLDAYLEANIGARYDRLSGLLQKWNEFTVAVADDAHRYRREQLVMERRKFARIVAADPRWQGGYAGALALLGEEDK